MKKLLLVVLLLPVSFAFVANSYVLPNDVIVEPNPALTSSVDIVLNENFPDYEDSMDLGVDCKANCTFSSCSGSGACTCSCSWFSCNCRPNKEALELAFEVSMNKLQYNRTRILASVLKSLDEDNADNAYKQLVVMVKSPKSKDYNIFYKEREVFLNEIGIISGKEQLNSLFEILEAEERV